MICSLVHKFGSREETEVENDAELNDFLNNIRTAKGGFAPKGKIVVFVDECHRTQSGKLHEAMKSLLPDAIFVGFTGTPLLKTDKKQSVEVFGGFIHTYKFNEAVKDGVVLDLLYEARDIEQSLSSPKRVDDWFEAKTRGMTDIAKTQLKQRWGTMQKLLSSKNRLEKSWTIFCWIWKLSHDFQTAAVMRFWSAPASIRRANAMNCLPKAA